MSGRENASRQVAGRKGMLLTVESIIAVSIILIASVIFLGGAKYNPERDIRSDGYRVLEYLDNSGTLRIYAMSNDTQSIKTALKPVLNYDFDVSICSECQEPYLPSGTAVSAVEYHIAGDRDNFSPRKIVLYMWR